MSENEKEIERIMEDFKYLMSKMGIPEKRLCEKCKEPITVEDLAWMDFDGKLIHKSCQ